MAKHFSVAGFSKSAQTVPPCRARSSTLGIGGKTTNEPIHYASWAVRRRGHRAAVAETADCAWSASEFRSLRWPDRLRTPRHLRQRAVHQERIREDRRVMRHLRRPVGRGHTKVLGRADVQELS